MDVEDSVRLEYRAEHAENAADACAAASVPGLRNVSSVESIQHEIRHTLWN